MTALIPIFLDKWNEFYSETTGYELICVFLESVKKAKLIDKIIVITNDKSLYALLDIYRNKTFLVKICKESETNSSSALPPGSDTAIQFIEKNVVKDSDLMILNFRNPLITSSLMDDAINQFYNSDGKLIVSVKETIDNPCQLTTYYKVIDINVIFLIDTDVNRMFYFNKVKHFFDKIDEKNILVTHPFYFDWDSKKISDLSECGFYFRQLEDTEMSYIPIESLMGKDKPSYGDCDLIICETKSSARLLSCTAASELNSQQNSDYSIASLSLLENINPNFSLMKNENNEYFIGVNLSHEYNDNYVLKIHKIVSSSKIDTISTDLIIDSRKHLYEIQTDLRDSTGIICSILKYSENDDYDCVEPFIPTKKLWDVDSQNTLINTKTGEKITGRQGFPEIFEPDGSFFIIKQKENKDLIRGIINKNANAYVLKENESLQIKTKLEYLRYRAILKSGHS